MILMVTTSTASPPQRDPLLHPQHHHRRRTVSMPRSASPFGNAFASLNPQTDPCPGYQAGEWPRAHACGKQFLSGPLALAAARAGWSAVDLFGIHKITGVAARDCIGALTGNTTNGFVARIEADALQFTNGTKVRKRSLDSNICIPIWSFRAR
jgi:hypothetical protein